MFFFFQFLLISKYFIFSIMCIRYRSLCWHTLKRKSSCYFYEEPIMFCTCVFPPWLLFSRCFITGFQQFACDMPRCVFFLSCSDFRICSLNFLNKSWKILTIISWKIFLSHSFSLLLEIQNICMLAITWDYSTSHLSTCLFFLIFFSPLLLG